MRSKKILEPNTIEKIREFLNEKPRDRLLFEMALQTGLRFKDLLNLRVSEVTGLVPGQEISVKNGKWNYPHAAVMSHSILKALTDYLEQSNLRSEDYLFRSRKQNQPLTQTSLSHLINGWFHQAGVKGVSAARAIRRTWEQAGNWTSFELPAAMTGAGLDILGPVKATTLKETVYQELLAAILASQIRPGENLIAEKIAERMEVSPMPVREALHILEAQGFITTQSRKGRIVNRLSRENLEEVLQLRLQLESQAAEAGVEKLTPEVMVRLRDLHRRYLSEASETETFSLNKEFHHLIYRQANQPILMEIIQMLWNKISPYLHIFARFAGMDALEKSREYHEQMMKALEAGDPKEVSKWIKADLREAAYLIGLTMDGDGNRSNR